MSVSQTKPLIQIVATGGTIANTVAGRISIQQVIEDIRRNFKDTAGILDRAQFEVADLCRVGSELFTSKEFLAIARAVNRLAQEPKTAGVIVTQGTVTSEETAYFLHLLVRSEKPLVLTNSQRRHGTVGNDGDRNFVDAVNVVLSPEAFGKGLLLVSNQTINSGREVLKTSARPDAFVSGEHGILGIIETDGVFFYRSPTRRHTVNSEFDVTSVSELPKVEVISAYYDADPRLIQSAVDLGVKGIVLNGLTTRGTPDALQRPLLEELIEKGIPVVRTARGGVNNRVTVLPNDKLIGGDNLPAHKARILLQLALTKTSDVKQIQRIFNEY
jgi:L-asparaginase